MTLDPEIESSEEGYSSDEDNDYSHLDLAEALKQEIEDGEYTCLICTGEIDSHSKIWSCNVCWRVYDLDCIKDWSNRGMKDKNNRVDGYQSWKCPSCNTPHYEPVKEYTCWCGKTSNPPYNGLMPHSCGQTCNNKLGCVHGCSLMCHPGPHADCTAIGPSLRCKCGNHRKQLPCIITPYNGWQCDDICGEILPCGEHRCRRKCHDGLCGSCDQPLNGTCFCGKLTKDVACSERHPALSETGNSKWIGYFSCGDVCNEKLDCGLHHCESKCHSRQLDDHKCPMNPIEGEKCPCSKTLVSEILGHGRKSCQDEIPVCNKSCGKVMDCGHECMSTCHSGACPPCRHVLPTKCACGSQLYDAPCPFTKGPDRPKCNRKCTALMDCRRHRCNKTCCEYEPKAAERERDRKKKLRGNLIKSNSSNEPIEQVHRCQEVCNKTLNCGKHRCVMTCHSGPCRPCIESSPHDYHCPCGRTTLQAPIRCGSMLPTCKHSCTLEPSCGHPRVDHPCHDPQQTLCPKCPHIVERLCVCGKSTIKGVQCHIQTVSCGRICGKTLPCGHACTKICHKDGQCITICKSQCGTELPCGHKHKALCHAGRDCGNVLPKCNETITLKCKCGHLNKTQKCAQEPIKELECDESCAVAERNRQLAEALKIDLNQREAEATHHEYSSDLLDIYHAEPSWCDGIEQQLIDFVKAYTDPQAKKVLKFPPMRSVRRKFIHMLCEEFGIDSMAQDPEPNRSVTVMNPAKGTIPKSRLRRYYNPW